MATCVSAMGFKLHRALICVYDIIETCLSFVDIFKCSYQLLHLAAFSNKLALGTPPVCPTEFSSTH